MIQINSKIEISESELVFRTSRSSGPGGQNVNKVNTRVTLFFDIAESPALSAPEKSRIRRKLASRVSKAGLMRVVSQKYRTQSANRSAAIKRFAELLRTALEIVPRRKKTKISYSETQKRLQKKKQRSLLKKQRAPVKPSND